jgi:hypothetical protein
MIYSDKLRDHRGQKFDVNHTFNNLKVAFDVGSSNQRRANFFRVARFN